MIRPGMEGMEFDCISSMDNILLEKRYSEEEVWAVLLGMKGNKALGLDRFTISFFLEMLGYCEEGFDGSV